jgi:hypothetical protein
VSDQPQSDREISRQADTNATWHTVVSKNIPWCRLMRGDLDEIRNEALEFIGQSATPADARIEWFLTLPGRREVVTLSGKRPTRSSRPGRVRWELQATETGEELRSTRPSPGLESMIERIAERQGRVPRVLRHVEFSAVAPGYEYSMRVGSPSFRSPRVTIRFTAPEPGIPLAFRTVLERLNKRSQRWIARRVFCVWMLALLLMIEPASVIPHLYNGFQRDPNRDTVTAQTIGLALGYLIGVPIVIGASLSATAARVTLSRASRTERIAEAFLWPARAVVEVWRTLGRDTKVLAVIGLAAILVALLAWLRPR